MNDEIDVQEIQGQKAIREALELIADSLFNQAVNNPDALDKLSKKYAVHGNVITISYHARLTGLCAYYDNKESAYISMLVISKNRQHCGLGTMLLEEVLHRCQRVNSKKVYLEVSACNIPAITFYEINGFKLQCADREKKMLMLEKSIKK